MFRILSSLDVELPPILNVRPPDITHRFTDSSTKKPLILDKRSVLGYLRPFLFKFEGLEGIPALEPYSTRYLDQKNVQKKKIKKASRPNFNEQETDNTHSVNGSECSAPTYSQTPTQPQPPSASPQVEWSRKAGDNFLRGLMTYPLSEAQLNVVRFFASQTTIVFTDLLDLEQILKLIALSVQVTIPYYGHCLFPNLRNVVYSSSFRLKLMQARYADRLVRDPLTSKVRSDVLPHWMSILLYWLADSYNACIHYPSAGEKGHAIEEWAKRLHRDIGCEYDEAPMIAEKSWVALDTLKCMLSTDSLRGLRGLSLHSVQVGATFDLDINVKTVIRFAPRSVKYDLGCTDTIESMANLIKNCMDARAGSVTYHNLEHLVTNRPFGPVMSSEMKDTKAKLQFQLINKLMKGFGKCPIRTQQVKKRCHEGDTMRISKGCRICEEWCEESDCSENSKPAMSNHVPG